MAVRGCSLAIVLIIMWLSIKAKIDVCKRGDVTVKPSHVISLGSTVNISCTVKPKKGCQNSSSFNRLILYEFNRTICFHHGDSFTTQVSDLPLGTTLFVCKLACINENELQICGAEISVGVVPEQPQGLSCMQKGEHGTVVCTWDRGRETHLYTKYTLELNGPKILNWKKQCNDQYCDHLDFGFNLTPELHGSSFIVKVTAINMLGNSSLASMFTFLDIVRPLPPWDVGIIFLNASVSRCILQWRDEEWVLLNRLRYRLSSSRSWKMVNVTNARGRHDLLDLKPFTDYEFQVSSKLHPNQGSWSDWSEPLRTQTPEEEPTGTLDVWYMKEHVDDNKEHVFLFWKNLSASEARGRILYYQVTLQEMAKRKTIAQNFTRHTSWTWVIPRTGNWAATVSAANSKGISLPTHINMTDLCGTGLLAPHQVSVSPEGTDSILVTWQPPKKAAPAVLEYVVDWKELLPGGSTQPPLNWLRLPPYRVSAVLSENIQPYMCYKIRVHALSAGQVGCSSILGNSKHKAPLRGPHINSITEDKGRVLISWDHLPAKEQRGCVLHYRIHWKERDSNSQHQFCEIPYKVSQNSHPIHSLQPQVRYVLWMTALTAAGESAPGNEREFCLPDKSNWNMFVAPSICVAVIIIGLFSVRYFRQKVFVLLSALRPQWCSRKIPDPANSTWAKNYPIVEEQTQLLSERLRSPWASPDEPEPLVINEVIHVVTALHRPPLGLTERVQGHCILEGDTVLSASDPLPPRALAVEARPAVDLYKMLGTRAPDSKPGSPAGPMTGLPVDYIPTHEGYLPSNTDGHPPSGAPLPEPGEDLQLQHISFSVFYSSIQQLPFSCGEKLTLDQLKMGCDPLGL
ncbi:interleukin-12 receptor subunit beta-2 [Ochotona curzoniae]|uniref:interleukin-12 receptor subunit beta-2 n=1 Tax=Ochotona curzoniae TaxID=130825 RepID=UPI001B354131|nr:interleukin-12 receptor subunit beta-2 [Ochotona curzoniae]